MRTFILSGLLLLLYILPGCNNFKAKHPQAGLPDEAGDTNITDKSTLNFAASVDRELHTFRKEYTLIYKTGDLSMYVEKYSEHNNAALYKMYTANGIISNAVKSYYLRNDSLLLVRERTKTLNEEAELFKDTRTYLRNNIIFKVDSRTASSADALRTLPYLLNAAADSKYPEDNYTEDIRVMDDAIHGRNKFEMVFDHITTYPDARYITLKSKTKNDYKANILVKSRDAFIDSLMNFPALYREEKLKLSWKIEDQDAVYVPEAAGKTSASGLNK